MRPDGHRRLALRALLPLLVLTAGTAAAPPPDPAPVPVRPPPPAAAVASGPPPAPPEEPDAPEPSSGPSGSDAEPVAAEAPAPARPAAPVADGAAGADVAEAVGVRIAPPRARTQAAPAATDAEVGSAEAARPAVTPTAASEPSAATERPVGPEADGPPTDGVILLVGLLVLGLTLGVRAVRARQSAVGVGLLVYCATFLVVLGAVLAGVAVAAPGSPATLTAVAEAPDRVTLRWSPAPDEAPVVAWRVLRDDVAIADLPPEVTTHSDSGLRPGVTYRYAVRPLDAPPGELGATTSVRTPPVVPVAPLPVLDLRAVVQARRVVVSWRMPPSRARLGVVVVRRRGRAPAGRLDGQVLLRGRGTLVVDHPVSARPVHYAVWTVDDAGRPSDVARVRLGRFLPALRTPAEGAPVGARPVLRWRRVAGAAYYNVQVWRGTRLRKVVTAWPAGPSYRPAALRPGRYTWYVYPGFGARRAVRYGSLLGAGTFRVVRPTSAPRTAGPRAVTP